MIVGVGKILLGAIAMTTSMGLLTLVSGDLVIDGLFDVFQSSKNLYYDQPMSFKEFSIGQGISLGFIGFAMWRHSKQIAQIAGEGAS